MSKTCYRRTNSVQLKWRRSWVGMREGCWGMGGERNRPDVPLARRSIIEATDRAGAQGPHRSRCHGRGFPAEQLPTARRPWESVRPGLPDSQVVGAVPSGDGVATGVRTLEHHAARLAKNFAPDQSTRAETMMPTTDAIHLVHSVNQCEGVGTATPTSERIASKTKAPTTACNTFIDIGALQS